MEAKGVFFLKKKKKRIKKGRSSLILDLKFPVAFTSGLNPFYGPLAPAELVEVIAAQGA
jgi:hypothetical protein